MRQDTKSTLKKSIVFLYTKDEASEKEIEKVIPILFYCSIKNNKILKNSLPKEVEIPYNENNKILLKEIREDTNKWKDISVCGFSQSVQLLRHIRLSETP